MYVQRLYVLKLGLLFLITLLMSAQLFVGGAFASELRLSEVSSTQKSEQRLQANLAGQRVGLLVLGDSISAAYGIDKSLGWVALLEERLEQQCPRVSVHNASVSGETTAGGLLRMPGLLERFDPALVVIELGGNDGLRGLSPAQMQSNFKTMIGLVRDTGAEPVLLGILIPPNYGEAYRQLFEQAIADVSRQEQVSLLGFFLEGVANQAVLMQSDGLHPTAQAQPRLLANAWQVLDKPLQGLCAEYSHSNKTKL